MWASWPRERSVLLDGACSTVAVSTFGADRFTAEIVWPLAVIAFGIFTSRAKPSFSPLVTVSGNAPELAVAVPAEPVTCSNPEQPATPEEGCVQNVSKTSENVTARLLYVPAGTATAAERSAESLCKRVSSATKLLVVPETKPTLVALPEEGVTETPVTVARNVRMERCADGEGGVARRVSESVALPVPPPPPPPCRTPPHAHRERINEDNSKPDRIRFVVGPETNEDAFGT